MRILTLVFVSISLMVAGCDPTTGNPSSVKKTPGSPAAEEIFKRRDENGDGKLTGDEIPVHLRDRLAQIDKDGDGAVVLEEFQEQMRSSRGGGERGPGQFGSGSLVDDNRPKRPRRPELDDP